MLLSYYGFSINAWLVLIGQLLILFIASILDTLIINLLLLLLLSILAPKLLIKTAVVLVIWSRMSVNMDTSMSSHTSDNEEYNLVLLYGDVSGNF